VSQAARDHPRSDLCLQRGLVDAGADGGRLALTGLPGVGKTQVALEFAYRYAASYDIVWWVSASHASRARGLLADLGDELKLPRRDDMESQVAAGTAKPTSSTGRSRSTPSLRKPKAPAASCSSGKAKEPSKGS
jgi:hypothetical protein